MNCKTNYQINFGFVRTNFGLCDCKIPRWNFDKFEGADRTLGLQMKSVGEVIGWTFVPRSTSQSDSVIRNKGMV
jgi:hypothetical protein